MVFPEFLKPGDMIGVSAFSHPIDEEKDQNRFRNGAKQLEQRGYQTCFTANVFQEADPFGRSGSGKEKAQQLHELLKNKHVRGIYSAAGGDFLAEMLPYIDLDLVKSNPKWIQGYSDNTSLLYYLTTKGGIATAYGANFSDFGMEEWDLSVERGLKVLEGSCRVQESFDQYQDGFGNRENGLEGYARDRDVFWNCINTEDGSCTFRGRLLGGCMDVLLNIAGTRYDGTLEFLERYREDGIIWYLESFDLHFEMMMEGLWKMKELGWFAHTTGFLFGRPLFYPEMAYDGTPLPSYQDVLLERLSPYQVPIITGADIGHKGPQFVMLNGALAEVHCAKGKGRITYL